MEEEGKTEDTSRILFEKFVSTCRNGHKSADMEKILLKTRGYYNKAKETYIMSKEFQNLITKKTEEIVNDPHRIYVYIKDVVDEIRSRRQKPPNALDGPPNKKMKLSSDDCENTTADTKNDEKENVGEENGEKIDIGEIASRGESRYINAKIKKLSKALKKVSAVIKKLEETEVDFDEENDSSYIKLERYKERFCKINNKLCELTGDRNAGKRPRIAFSGTQSTEINRCIERFVNSTGQFPDFHDILSLVKKTDVENKMKADEQRKIAENAFLTLGRQLQKQRQFESWDSVSVFLKDVKDPAEDDQELEKQLNDNALEHSERIQKVIDSFAEKQVDQKLEPEEVPDDVANKSDNEAEDEEQEESEEDEEDDIDIVEEVLREDNDDSMDENEEQNEDDSHSGDQSDNENNIEVSKQETQDAPTINTEMLNNDSNHSKGCSANSDENDCSDGEDSTVSKSLLDDLGPVSPPILGEDLSNRGMKITSKKELCVPEVIPLDTVSENDSHISEDLKPQHESDTFIETKGSETNYPRISVRKLSNMMPLKKPPNDETKSNLPCTSKQSNSSSGTSITDDDLPSPSLLEPSIEMSVVENKKRAAVTSLKSDNRKFVPTAFEVKREFNYSPGKMRTFVRQKPRLNRYSSSLKASSQSVDVITLE